MLSHGSQFEIASALSRENVLTIADAPGIKFADDGKPIVSASEYLVRGSCHQKKRRARCLCDTLRGVGPKGFAPAARN